MNEPEAEAHSLDALFPHAGVDLAAMIPIVSFVV